VGKTRGLGWIGLLTLGVGCASLLDLPDGDYHVECVAGETQCVGKTVQVCQDGLWTNGEVCPYGCSNGVCGGECSPGDKRCLGNQPQSCDNFSAFQDTAECTVSAPVCDAGLCKLPLSCTGLPSNCGPSADESCCNVKAVSGGTYNRSNAPSAPAMISDFRLDRFEITVGRFRKFVEAYPSNKPKANAGAHPLIAGSGWDAAWDANLPADQVALKSALKCDATYQTWTDTPMANENLPMNCISWYEAFVFCAWEGGRLPTEAEWNYAAAGGNEQREYPWSNPPNATTIDVTYAVYMCAGDGSQAGICAFADILKVGSKSPKGDGRFGQADLAGSVWEWNLDVYDDYNADCANCTNLSMIPLRMIRGGGWSQQAPLLLSSNRNVNSPELRGIYNGARCARTP